MRTALVVVFGNRMDHCKKRCVGNAELVTQIAKTKINKLSAMNFFEELKDAHKLFVLASESNPIEPAQALLSLLPGVSWGYVNRVHKCSQMETVTTLAFPPFDAVGAFRFRDCTLTYQCHPSTQEGSQGPLTERSILNLTESSFGNKRSGYVEMIMQPTGPRATVTYRGYITNSRRQSEMFYFLNEIPLEATHPVPPLAQVPSGDMGHFASEVRCIDELCKGLQNASIYPAPRTELWHKVFCEVTGLGMIPLEMKKSIVLANFEFNNCNVELYIGNQPWGPLKKTDMLNLSALSQHAFTGMLPSIFISNSNPHESGICTLKYCAYTIDAGSSAAFQCEHGWWGRHTLQGPTTKE
jgi:hypothetical protein